MDGLAGGLSVTPHPDPLPARGEGVPPDSRETWDSASPLEGRGREERAGEGWVKGARRFVRRNAWLVSVLAVALLIGQLPMLLAACCAPPGATGLGTVWFVNDFAQYESAMRQGAEQSGWLIHDAFTAEPHPAAFMFPLYVGVGKLAATLHVPAALLEHVLEVLARATLVIALWRFARTFAAGPAAAQWAFALALFASGFELFIPLHRLEGRAAGPRSPAPRRPRCLRRTRFRPNARRARNLGEEIPCPRRAPALLTRGFARRRRQIRPL